jgi:hypothetical protein
VRIGDRNVFREFVAFVRDSKIGLNPARSVDRAKRNL